MPILGQDYSLTCVASVDQQVSAGLSLVLIDQENGSIIASGSHAGMAFMTSSPQSTAGLTLFFQSLNSSSQGNYTCVANLSLPGIQRTASSKVTHALRPLVLSKLHN